MANSLGLVDAVLFNHHGGRIELPQDTVVDVQRGWCMIVEASMYVDSDIDMTKWPQFFGPYRTRAKAVDELLSLASRLKCDRIRIDTGRGP